MLSWTDPPVGEQAVLSAVPDGQLDTLQTAGRHQRTGGRQFTTHGAGLVVCGGINESNGISIVL